MVRLVWRGVSLHLCAVGIGSAVHLPGASVIDAARDVVEGLLPVRGGERLLPRHCVQPKHEADMDEPEGAEPTAEEYNAFFDAIMAMP